MMDDFDDVLEWVWRKATAVASHRHQDQIEAIRTELAAARAGIDTYRASVAGVEALRDELAAAKRHLAEAVDHITRLMAFDRHTDDVKRAEGFLAELGFVRTRRESE